MDDKRKEYLGKLSIIIFGFIVSFLGILSGINALTFVIPNKLIGGYAFYEGMWITALLLMISSALMIIGCIMTYMNKKGSIELSIVFSVMIFIFSISLLDAITVIFSLLLFASLLSLRK